MSEQEESKERSVSEVILSMEQNLISIHKMIGVYDFNTKIILDKVNKIYSLLSQNTEVKNNIQAAKIEQPNIVQNQKFLPIEEKPIIKNKTFNVNSSGKTIPVVQRIVNQENKDIFMAEVIVNDNNNNLLAKTKTNAVGKWQANLPTGTYKISVSKMDTATKKRLNYSGDIVIEVSEGILNLPNIVLIR